MEQVLRRSGAATLGEALVREFEGQLPPGAVLRCVARCREELRRAGVRHGLDDALEAMSRRRLQDRAQPATS